MKKKSQSFQISYNFSLLQILNEMGCTSMQMSSEDDQIIIATLNYSGILESPFEFYENETEEEKQLSKQFQKYSREYINDKALQEPSQKPWEDKDFNWGIGSLDKVWQKRFTPLYMPSCGIKNRVFMMNETQFKKEWMAVYHQSPNYIAKAYEGKETTEKIKEFQRDAMMNFDYLIYKTLIWEIYGEQVVGNISSESFSVNAKKYRQKMKKNFSKSFLNEEKKVEKTLEAINKFKIDILFLQESSQDLVKQVEKQTNDFRIARSLDGNVTSVILIRENKFPKIRSLKEENSIFTENIKKLTSRNSQIKTIPTEEFEKLNFNRDTVIQAVGNLILICPHLTSKKKVNPQQVKEFKQGLRKLKQWFPDNSIIVGGDLNGPLDNGFTVVPVTEQGEMPIDFNVFPNFETNITANKKRTMLQPQKNKANELSAETKDYLASDLQILNGKIITIQGKQIKDRSINPFERQKDPLLPLDSHPYDHYLVIGTVKLLRPLIHVMDPEYLQFYKPYALTLQQLQELDKIKKDRQKQSGNNKL